MILKYKGFMKINEANVKSKLKRSDLKVGDEVMTNGTFDGVNMDYQIGKIIAMREYGNILVEFEKKFNNKLHSGANDIGKPNQCYYIKFENIISNDRVEFEKILNKIDKAKKEENERLNVTYKEGDVIVGIGEMTGYRKLNVDGEVGIVYYEMGPGVKGGSRNRSYWIGFLDKFSDILMKNNEDGSPANGAGFTIDKLHMRHITDEERERVKDKLEVALKHFNNRSKSYEIGDIVKIVNDNGMGIKLKGKLGVIMTPKIKSGYNQRAIIQYVKFLDVDYPYFDPIMGYQLNVINLELADENDIKGNENELKNLQQDAIDFNHPYKIGDWVIAYDRNDRAFDNQPGKVVNIEGVSPYEYFTIEFLTRFSIKLRNIGKYNNCANLQRRNLSVCKDTKIEELIKKLESGKIKPFIASDMLIAIMDRTDLRSSIPFFSQAYFDLGETSDNITFLPVDKIVRLEAGENPYKSRFRQPMGVGKFIRMLQPNLKEKQIEIYTNSFKANFDVVKGVTDRLELVSGEDVRYWYNENNYVTGGGTLWSSCMRSPSKGPEMQMFVDNPDVVQLLILTNGQGKLLGRALVWRLVEPYGATYMDPVYTRYEKDAELFYMYAKSKGWIARVSYSSNRASMVCALFNGKKYHQGKDALDHFDTFHLGHTQDYLTNAGSWTRPKDLVKPKWEGVPDVNNNTTVEGSKPIEKVSAAKEPFPLNTRIIYQKPGAVNNNKKGIFVGLKEDGKAKIIFDDGGKYALKVEYLKETD